MTASNLSSNTAAVYLIRPTNATQCHTNETLKYNFCLTLEEYIKKDSVNVSSNTTLFLMPGTHIINTSLGVKNIDTFIKTGYEINDENESYVICKGSVWVYFENVTYLKIKDISLNLCGKPQSNISMSAVTIVQAKTLEISGVAVQYSQQSGIAINDSNATVTNLTIAGNNGIGLYSEHSTINILGTSISQKNSNSSIMVYESEMFLHGVLSFYQNQAKYGGAMYIHNSTVVSDAMLNFTSNSATGHGGAMYIVASEVNLTGNVRFVNNCAGIAGGGIMQLRTHEWLAAQSSNKIRIDTVGNQQLCAAIFYGTLNLNGIFQFQNNHALWGGALYTSEMKSVQLSGNSTFINNLAKKGGGIFAQCLTKYTLNGTFLFKNNTAEMGGAINMYKIITKQLGGDLQFLYNMGSSGGGIIYFYMSSVTFESEGEVLFLGNSAHTQGGGLFLYQTRLQVESKEFKLCDNSAQVSGGALYMQGSKISFNSTAMLLNNSASFGGGGYLTAQSYLSFNTEAQVIFSNNRAMNYGGALLIHDEDYSVTCMVNSLKYVNNACFYQPADIHKYLKYLHFNNNTAQLSGNILYGGTIDLCQDLTMSKHLYFRNFSVFKEGNNGISDISSDGYKICLCDSTKTNCTDTTSKHIFPGESFKLGVVTVGQLNGSVPSSVLAFPHAALGPLQTSQQTNASCTNLTYTVFSMNSSVRISLNVGGRCSTTGNKLILNVSLKPCPNGFVISKNLRRCVCAEQLRPYTNTCSIDDETISRTNNYFWVNYDTQLKGLILGSFCPHDYCKPPPINFTLQHPNEQCNYNRIGRLCGQCPHNLSLVLGTSKCKQCSNKFISLLAIFSLAGLLLLTSVLVLRATVAVGTFNGIII